MRAHPVKVDPKYVQTHVLRSLDPAYAVYAFFRITDLAAFRDLLKKHGRPTSLREALRKSAGAAPAKRKR